MGLTPFHEQSQAIPGMIESVLRTKLWRLFPFLILYNIGVATLLPVIPTILTNGFASEEAGYKIDCHDFEPEDAPIACRDAHSTAVTWSSWTSFVQSSLLTFLCAPLFGYFSDRVGRKPFMLAGVCLMFPSAGVLLLYTHGLVRIQWYFPAAALNGVVSALNMCIISVADLLNQKHRATVVGYLTACVAVGNLIGPAIGGYLTTQHAILVCLGITAASVFYVVLFVHECSPAPVARRCSLATSQASQAGQASWGSATTPGSQSATGSVSGDGKYRTLHTDEFRDIEDSATDDQETEEDMDAPLDVVCSVINPATITTTAINPPATAQITASSPAPSPRSLVPPAASPDAGYPNPSGLETTLLAGWLVIKKSSFYQKLAVIWFLSFMTWAGTSALLLQYLQLQMGLGTRGQAHLLVMSAALSLGFKLTLLAFLVTKLGERNLLLLGMCASALETAGLAVAPTKPLAFVAVAIGSLSALCWPAMIALQTSRVEPRHRGALAGVLQGLNGFGSGLGPVLFAALFSVFSRSDSKVGYFPQVVWYAACWLTVTVIVIVLCLDTVKVIVPAAVPAKDWAQVVVVVADSTGVHQDLQQPLLTESSS